MPELRTSRETLLQAVGHQVLDLVFPRMCPGCDHPLGKRHQFPLCEPCAEELHPLQEPFCLVCGEKFHGHSMATSSCSNCRDRAFAFDFARASYHSHGLLRDLIHRMKYQRARYLIPLLTDLLAKNLEDPRVRAERDWIVVPVPLHPKRLRQRRFNQAEELALRLAKSCGWLFLDALHRKRFTPPQAELDRRDRLQNLGGAFALRSHQSIEQRLSGATVLLVDDVFTTGSTAHECSKTLKLSGSVSKVGVITVARAGTPALG